MLSGFGRTLTGDLLTALRLVRLTFALPRQPLPGRLRLALTRVPVLVMWLRMRALLHVGSRLSLLRIPYLRVSHLRMRRLLDTARLLVLVLVLVTGIVPLVTAMLTRHGMVMTWIAVALLRPLMDVIVLIDTIGRHALVITPTIRRAVTGVIVIAIDGTTTQSQGEYCKDKG